MTDYERRLGILPPGRPYVVPADISDHSRCPSCVAERDRPGYADRYFGGAGQLWAICERHGLRWYVTRELTAAGIPEVPDEPGSLFDLEQVDGVHLTMG
jgi:hypothetical protein